MVGESAPPRAPAVSRLKKTVLDRMVGGHTRAADWGRGLSLEGRVAGRRREGQAGPGGRGGSEGQGDGERASSSNDGGGPATPANPAVATPVVEMPPGFDSTAGHDVVRGQPVEPAAPMTLAEQAILIRAQLGWQPKSMAKSSKGRRSKKQQQQQRSASAPNSSAPSPPVSAAATSRPISPGASASPPSIHEKAASWSQWQASIDRRVTLALGVHARRSAAMERNTTGLSENPYTRLTYIHSYRCGSSGYLQSGAGDLRGVCAARKIEQRYREVLRIART